MKAKPVNPESLVPAGEKARLRGFSAEAEAAGRLTVAQLAAIYDNRWFKLFVPRAFGGLELTLPEGVRIEEELAGIDGSLGWTVTLCSGANLFVGYMDRSVTPAIFTDPAVCLGGSGQASGRAIITDGGYRVSGEWHYATGAPHLTHFTANCVLEKDGKVLMGQDGHPIVKSFFFARDDVRIIEDWKAFGLKATASHSFRVADLSVDATHAFSITPADALLDHPVYRYPFLQFAEATLAVNTLGMAMHFMECAMTVRTAVGELAQNGLKQIVEAKVLFYEALDASWAELVTQGSVSREMLEAVSRHSRILVGACRAQVVGLYPHLGLVAADPSSEINRIWRDLFTASQHSLLRS